LHRAAIARTLMVLFASHRSRPATQGISMVNIPHTSAAKAFFAAAALLAFSLPSHALVRSADNLGMCFDNDNQKIWMDWTQPAENDGMREGRLRVGEYCVIPTLIGREKRLGARAVPMSDHACFEREQFVWRAHRIGGTRYRLMAHGDRCATLTTKTPQAGQWIDFVHCTDGTTNLVDARIIHLRQFWWLEQ
jgi:hypothetical protein